MSKRFTPKLTRIQRDSVTGVTTVTHLTEARLAFEYVRNLADSKAVRLPASAYPEFAALVLEWAKGMQRGGVK